MLDYEVELGNFINKIIKYLNGENKEKTLNEIAIKFGVHADGGCTPQNPKYQTVRQAVSIGVGMGLIDFTPKQGYKISTP